MAKDPENKELQAKFYKKIQESKCSKKRRFASQHTAILAGQGLARLTPYQCKVCNYWHLTSKGPPIG